MSRPVVRIRGHLKPSEIAKLLKKNPEPTPGQLLRLLKDQYGYSHADLEVEIALQPDKAPIPHAEL